MTDTPPPNSATRTRQRLALPQVITMDGPSASGKGTLSRRLAQELGYTYVDSGAMYRTLAWYCLQRHVPLPATAATLTPAAAKPVIRLLRRWKAELKVVDGAIWLHVDGYFPRTEIRSDAVEKVVPIIAQIGKVRDWMVARQRDCVNFGPLVMEGRDIGTEVFPLAPVKFFLDANPAARAARMQERGNSAGTERDHLDMNRKQGALIPALDAIRLDNTGQSVAETFALLLQHVPARLKPVRSWSTARTASFQMTIRLKLPRSLLPGLLAAWWWAGGVMRTLAGGGEVVLVYTIQLPDSKAVAEYYAQKRGVPTNQIIGLDVPAGDTISRPDYVRLIQNPLLKELANRGLVTFHLNILSAKNDRPGRVQYQPIAAKVRYLALCFGLPFRIAHDPGYDPHRDDDAPDGLAPALRRDEASVDSELMLLPITGRTPLFGAVRNPFLDTTNAAALHPTSGVLLVSRLDGPTPEIARGLVDKALSAERDGLNGRAYFDLRNISEGAYATGDRWITNAATVAKKLGFETVVDNRPETLGTGFPFAQVALYAGWYAAHAEGPFSLPAVEFMPGAIAYHLHSFSGQFIRDPIHNWVGPLLAKGAAVTLGCVEEPYLDLTPNIGIFFERLGVNGFTVGEAGLVCQPFLSWQNVLVGDPLYRPFGRPTQDLEQYLTQVGSPLLAWPLLRNVNVQLLLGRDPEALRQFLIGQPLATNSAVLAEKIARLFADRNRNRPAVEWAQRSLKLPDGSPQQHSRLWRDLAEWQRPTDARGALTSLEAFAAEFPHHPELLAVRRRELELAKNLSRKDEISRFKAEIARLEPPPATNAPAPVRP